MGSTDQVKENPVVLFDGVCNLCNQSVLLIIRYDPSATFKFTSIQSAQGQQLLALHGLDPTALHSIILIMGEKVFQRSRAALEIARRMSGAWPLFYFFIILPPFLRDGMYNLIASNRYRLFGKKDQCMIPTPDLKERFLA